MPPPTALIVGAGIGGLAASVALERAGWRTRIFERAKSPRDLGFALNLAANALSALTELGVADRVIAEGSVLEAVEFRHTNGRLLKRFTIPANEGRRSSVMALRPALHGALLAAVEPNALTLSTEAVGFDIEGAAVRLHLHDGRSETGDVLVGADGINSIVRRRLHPNEASLRPSGYYGVRGVAHDAAARLGSLDAVVYLGGGLEAATVRAGRRSVYWYIAGRASTAHVREHDPMTVVEEAMVRLDSGFRAFVDATRPEDIRFDELYDRQPLANWGRGPVTLLGDAAHPMLPQTGQGAAQALEDAVALGLALSDPGSATDALRRYERVRSARTAPIQRRGRRIASVATAPSAVLSALLTTVIRLAPARRLAAQFLLSEGPDPHRALRRSARLSTNGTLT